MLDLPTNPLANALANQQLTRLGEHQLNPPPEDVPGGRRYIMPKVNRELVRLYEHLRTPVAAGGKQSVARTIGVTGCERCVGTTHVAHGLALASLSLSEGRTLLIDANVTSPQVHERLSVDPTPGFSDVLLQTATLDQCIRTTPYAQLFVMPVGRLPADRSDVLRSTKTLKQVLAVVAKHFGAVIVDLPCVDACPSGILLMQQLDSVAVVVQAEKSRKTIISQTCDVLRRAQVRLTGAVLNRRQDHIPDWLYRWL